MDNVLQNVVKMLFNVNKNKKSYFWNCSLKGSLGNKKIVLMHRCENPMWNLYVKESNNNIPNNHFRGVLDKIPQVISSLKCMPNMRIC